MKPKVIILRTAGTNCDKETAFAFELAGAATEFVHVNQLFRKERDLRKYDILAIPGGFSYGDDIAAGKILANELRFCLSDKMLQFAKSKKPIIGICNGFQVLVKTGLLPGDARDFKQTATLTFNDSGKFIAKWVYLKRHDCHVSDSKCIWTRNLPVVIELPIAHGEGKFMVNDDALLEKLKENNQIAFQYCDPKGHIKGFPWNPTGSTFNIAGITNVDGSILGMMPHPERFISKYTHPRWTRSHFPTEAGVGLTIFKNAVEYVKSS